MTKKRRVLVVDDDATHRETLAMLLGSGGIDVVDCASGQDALLVLKRQRFDLILSDIVMPGMDGMEFARLARRLCPDTPLVLVTGRDSATDSIVADGNVALLKPYSTTTLNSVLLEHLGVAI